VDVRRWRRRARWLTPAVVVLVATGAWVGPTLAASSKRDRISFDLFPNPAVLSCLANHDDHPVAHVKVEREDLNDELTLTFDGLKPGLKFDLFTVEHSNQLADGRPDPNFKSFGLAWYQSDVEVGRGSHDHDAGRVTIHTILLDQIFGFDPDANLPPTNTFHVGFWFNDPADAAPCGFTGFTPFNGEHHAGPVAFISRPDARTGLGPLCSDPDSSKPSGCNP
jgi:hypothetical protein